LSSLESAIHTSVDVIKSCLRIGLHSTGEVG